MPSRASSPVGTLTVRERNRATLARQMLLARERVKPLRAIERLVGLQAQWPRPPFLGLWSRVEGFAREDLTRLLVDREAVRATFLRGTLHLVSARDFLALRPAIQPVLESGMGKILRARGARVDPDRVLAQAEALLAGGPRTFEELREELQRKDPKGNERAMGYAVRMLLPLVQVPEEGRGWAFPAQARFALADRWLKRVVSREAAPPDELIRRYLAAYGPATVADVQAWSGLGGLREAVESLRKHLLAFHDEAGRELLDLPDAPRPGADVPAPVRFVADYDNVITTRADERFVARRHRPRVFLSALRIAATVLVDGFVAATWKIDRRKGKATVTVEPFAPLSPRARREVAAEGEAILRFAEPDAETFVVRVGR
jgi:winged helix DNA-binding protein